MIWSLWRHINECLFRGAQPNLEALSELIKVRVAYWVKNNHIGSMYTFNDFISNLGLIRSYFGGGGVDCIVGLWCYVRKLAVVSFGLADFKIGGVLLVCVVVWRCSGSVAAV